MMMMMMIIMIIIIIIIHFANGTDIVIKNYKRLVGWLVALFYSVSTFFGCFNAELSHFNKSSYN